MSGGAELSQGVGVEGEPVSRVHSHLPPRRPPSEHGELSVFILACLYVTEDRRGDQG